MATVVVIGADGQLGHDLLAALADHPRHQLLAGLTLPDLDIRDFPKAAEVLASLRPQVIVNTAAFHAVDACEDDPATAFLVNAAAVHNLACICRRLDAVLVQFSSDYVFDGPVDRSLPFDEAEAPNPRSVYATSRLAGELAARNAWSKHFIIRTCGLYGIAGIRETAANFVEVMLRRAKAGAPIRVVNDQRATPTATVDLAAKVLELLEGDAFGLYHVTNSGSCTWFEFASEIFRLAGVTASLTGISSLEWGAKAHRPAFSVLGSAGLRRAGLTPLRPWQSALADYLTSRAQFLKKRSP